MFMFTARRWLIFLFIGAFFFAALPSNRAFADPDPIPSRSEKLKKNTVGFCVVVFLGIGVGGVAGHYLLARPQDALTVFGGLAGGAIAVSALSLRRAWQITSLSAIDHQIHQIDGMTTRLPLDLFRNSLGQTASQITANFDSMGLKWAAWVKTTEGEAWVNQLNAHLAVIRSHERSISASRYEDELQIHLAQIYRFEAALKSL